MKCNHENYNKRKKCPYYKVGYCKYKPDKCFLKEKKKNE
jgi:hypothetical protein